MRWKASANKELDKNKEFESDAEKIKKMYGNVDPSYAGGKLSCYRGALTLKTLSGGEPVWGDENGKDWLWTPEFYADMTKDEEFAQEYAEIRKGTSKRHWAEISAICFLMLCSRLQSPIRFRGGCPPEFWETPMDAMMGQQVKTYCETVYITPYAKFRLFELQKLTNKTFHHDSWVSRALNAVIFEVSRKNQNIVAAMKDGRAFGTPVYIIDLASLKLLTVFRLRKEIDNYLDLDGLVI